VNLWQVKSRDFALIDTGKSIPDVFTGANSTVRCLAINIDGSTLVSGYDDGVVRIWSANTYQLVNKIEDHKGAVIHVGIRLMPASRILGTATPKDKKGLPALQPLSNMKHEYAF